MSERQDDRDLKENTRPQNQPRNPDDESRAPEEEGAPGFGSAEYVPEAEDVPRDESGMHENSDADDEQDLIQD